jgi:AraC-like DNA-binding protein
MMPLRPICEPVELPLESSVFIDRVHHPESARARARLLHFHDVSELVLFEKVDGWFFADGKRYPLEGQSVIFVPSMHGHDFAIGSGERSWRLIQIDPYLVERLSHLPDGAHLTRAFWARCDQATFARLIALSDWLEEVLAANPADPQAVRITELILLTAAKGSVIDSQSDLESGDAGLERLLPAVELLRQHPDQVVTISEAATSCHLSASYFSRRFKQTFGVGFADYARAYRLHVAARRLSTSRDPLSKIARELGFSSPSHFTFRFHERFGMTPRAYRRGFRRH